MMGWNPEREAAIGNALAGLSEDDAAHEAGHAWFDYELLAAAPENGNGAAGHAAKRDDPAATDADPRARPQERPPLDERGAKRLERAEEIAKKEDCRAASAEEFETTYRAELVADGLREGDRLSDVVVERARNKFIDDAGGDDPIRRKLAGRFFDLDLLSAKLHATLARQGASGYKIAGSVANRMDRNVLEYATTLLKFPSKVQRSSAAAPDPEAEDRRRLAEHRERRRAQREEGAWQQWSEEKAAWDALSAEDREKMIRYEIAFEKAEAGKWPDRPVIVSDYEYLFECIPYLAPERFTDDDRKRSVWKPPPGWKQEVGPTSTATPFAPADIGPSIVEADAPSPAPPAASVPDEEDVLGDSTYKREEARFAALSLGDKAAIYRYCSAMKERRLRGAVGAAGTEPMMPDALKRERFLHFEQLVADAARSVEQFVATNAKQSHVHSAAGADSPAGT